MNMTEKKANAIFLIFNKTYPDVINHIDLYSDNFVRISFKRSDYMDVKYISKLIDIFKTMGYDATVQTSEYKKLNFWLD